MAAQGGQMKETAVLFGKLETLAGVVTDPDPSSESGHRPAILLLNAGLLYRIGPNRVYVRLARSLASLGFVTLRLDFSGIGDSEPRRDGLTIEESRLRDAHEAMDFLAVSRGIEQFVLIGLCGGAVNAFRISRDDPRVVGAVMIDGYAYRTFGYYLRHYGGRLLSGKRWWNLLTGRSSSGRKLRRMLQRGSTDKAEGKADVNPVGVSYIRRFPPRDAVLSDLHALIDRGVYLFFIYSEGGMDDYYNYESQFEDMFPSLHSNGRLRVKLIREADHTFTLLSHQRMLVDDIVDWVSTTITTSKQSATIRPTTALSTSDQC